MASSLSYNKSGQLHLGTHNLHPWIKKYKGPTYIYSKKIIRDRLALLRSAFKTNPHIHYAVKANSNPQILKFFKGQKTGADVVSGGEIKRALQSGFKGPDIIFSGVGKTAEEIEFGINKKIAQFNIESLQELERIASIAKRKKKKVNVSFRLNPQVNPDTHPYITTGFKENKFGMDNSFIPDLILLLNRNKKFVDLVGVSFHIGSQLTSISPFIDAVENTIPVYEALQELGFPMKYFDVGGGIGITYDKEKAFPLKQYGQEIERRTKHLGCQLLLEPGRFIMGPAGVLLTRVEYIKKTPYKNFVIVDSGMHHLMRPSLYQSYHQILPLKKATGKAADLDVVGPICESSDWLARQRKMPLPKQGDILAIGETGAYGFVMASDYNLHARPKEFLL